MHRIQVLAANVALFAMLGVAGAQQAGPIYPDTNVPDRAAPLTKSELKAQKAQQKKEEKASAKAAKGDTKAKKQHDEAAQAVEKANPGAPAVSAATASSTPPPAPQN